MKVFASVLTYELGKRHGIAGAARVLAAQFADPLRDGNLPCVRVLHHARELGDVQVYHGSATSLPKARSRAAHAFLESDADVWIMVDDDVETDAPTLHRLIALASDRVSVLPCVVRGVGVEQTLVNCMWSSPLVYAHGGTTVRGVLRAGCGLMVVPREGLEMVADMFRATLSFRDEDGSVRLALFHQLFFHSNLIEGVDWRGEGGGAGAVWLGEDYSFCERLNEARVPIVAPVEGVSVHDGVMLDLAECAP